MSPNNSLNVVVDQHMRNFPISAISRLAPFTASIISVVLVVFFLIKFYVLELFLLQKIYGSKYTDLGEINRRGFVNHHIAGATKIIILILAMYPCFDIVFGKSSFHTPFVHGSKVTMGDILIICSQMHIGMYIFELIYRTKISPVGAIHHIGTVLVGQAVIAISIRKDKDASIEFVLCVVWGAFDIISEFLPHLTIILYRVYPDSHKFLCKLFCTTCFTTLVGTISESIIIMYFFGQLWDRWAITFKIVTPLLHIAFSGAQLHVTNTFYKMWRKQQQILREQRDLERKTVDSEEHGEECHSGEDSVEQKGENAL